MTTWATANVDRERQSQRLLWPLWFHPRRPARRYVLPTRSLCGREPSTDTCLTGDRLLHLRQGLQLRQGTAPSYFSVTTRIITTLSPSDSDLCPSRRFTADNGGSCCSPPGHDGGGQHRSRGRVAHWKNILQFKDGSEFAVESRERNLRNWVVGYTPATRWAAIVTPWRSGWARLMMARRSITATGSTGWWTWIRDLRHAGGPGHRPRQTVQHVYALEEAMQDGFGVPPTSAPTL